jgi:uncharacterized OB-fold protein
MTEAASAAPGREADVVAGDGSLPRIDGLYESGPDGRIRLRAGRCRGCDHVMFPLPAVCERCHGEQIDAEWLGPDGAMHSFTVVHESFGLGSRPAPYGVALIEVADEVLVRGLVDGGCDGLRIGEPMETCEVTFNWDDGREGLTYGFRPRALP